MNILFTDLAWDDYVYWQEIDPKIISKINRLIRDIKRDPDGGIGKPERLKGDLSRWLSRRINLEHRLIYRVEGDALIIAQCRYHY